MSNELGKTALSIAQNIKREVSKHTLPPPDGMICSTQLVLPFSLVRGTRGYIEKVVHQINSSYENACYDACSVMIRRLLETLIIEAFEHHQIDSKIKDHNGDFLLLGDLVPKTIAETKWNLGRNTKKALPHLKDVGNLSAHNRRFNAHRSDIDKVVQDLRVAVQELVYLGGLK